MTGRDGDWVCRATIAPSNPHLVEIWCKMNMMRMVCLLFNMIIFVTEKVVWRQLYNGKKACFRCHTAVETMDTWWNTTKVCLLYPYRILVSLFGLGGHNLANQHVTQWLITEAWRLYLHGQNDYSYDQTLSSSLLASPLSITIITTAIDHHHYHHHYHWSPSLFSIIIIIVTHHYHYCDDNNNNNNV